MHKNSHSSGKPSRSIGKTSPRILPKADAAPRNNTATDWGVVADWYDGLLKGSDTYQEKVILPQITRLCKPFAGKRVLDLACGQGFFSRALIEVGAEVIGVDLSPELIQKAKESVPQATFHVSSASELGFLQNEMVEGILSVLALQNMDNVPRVFAECSRVLKPHGTFIFVLNHPVLRIPKASSWGFDEKKGVQYRRLDGYLAERREEIEMHPGKGNKVTTSSFHRPLQYYVKHLCNAGFVLTRLEEWVSHKESEEGPRKKAEDRARKEFPLFMMFEARKLSSELL